MTLRDNETNDAIASDHLIVTDDVYAVFDRASVNVFCRGSALVHDAVASVVDDDDRVDCHAVDDDDYAVVVSVCDSIDP